MVDFTPLIRDMQCYSKVLYLRILGQLEFELQIHSSCVFKVISWVSDWLQIRKRRSFLKEGVKIYTATRVHLPRSLKLFQWCIHRLREEDWLFVSLQVSDSLSQHLFMPCRNPQRASEENSVRPKWTVVSLILIYTAKAVRISFLCLSVWQK